MIKHTDQGRALFAQIDTAIATAPLATSLGLRAYKGRPDWRCDDWHGWYKPDSRDCERIGYVTFQAFPEGISYRVLNCKESLQALRRKIYLCLGFRKPVKHRAKPYVPYYPPMPEPERRGILYAMAEPELAEAA